VTRIMRSFQMMRISFSFVTGPLLGVRHYVAQVKLNCSMDLIINNIHFDFPNLLSLQMPFNLLIHSSKQLIHLIVRSLGDRLNVINQL
jgi:hypothetical protein